MNAAMPEPRPAPFQRAVIIAVGSELLTPLRIDTNSLYITEQLNALGIEVVVKGVVGDDRAELANFVRHALERAGLIVLCGGLGPTDDDVTREVVADVLQRKLQERTEITERLRQRFASRGWQMPEINRRQAMVPEGADPIDNPVSPNNVQALYELLGVLVNFETKVQSRLTDINQVLGPEPPPIEPQLRGLIVGRLRTLRDTALAVNQLASRTIDALSTVDNPG